MKTQRGMECWVSNITLSFGTTRTAELSAVRAGHTLSPPPLLNAHNLKFSKDTIGNRTRNLPLYGAVPEPTVVFLAPLILLQTNKSRITTRTWYCNYLALISSVQRVGYSCGCCLNLCWSSSIRCTQTAAYRQGYCRSIFCFPFFCPETGICRTGTRPVNRDT